MRVHELAKELGVSSRELLARLEKLGLSAASHMSALDEDQIRRIREDAAGKPAPTPVTPEKTPPKPTPPPPQEASPSAEASRRVTVHGPVIVKDFAALLGLKPNQLIAELMAINVFASINERIELKTARQIAARHGFELVHEKKTPERKPPRPAPATAPAREDRPEDLAPRPPVVTFLGHVDHGKTSLLDRIRSARVAGREAGGITQHIGAYTVEYNDHKITFLDTPGHAAFTAMRARGANLTDIAVLVIAADEGVMPQTREAIQHAQAAGVTIMVAINKIDLKTADPDRVKSQLQELGLTPEDWGGEVICCPVSAATGEGIDELLEMILLQADMLELKANPNRPAEGFVIEARMEPGMGPVASLLIKRGTLHVGDVIVAGFHWGKVKALINDRGVKVRTAAPSDAVQCLGLTDVPGAGDAFMVYSDERAARSISEQRREAQRRKQLATSRRVSLDDLLRETSPEQKQVLPVVLKADVQGTLEAVEQALGEIKSDKVEIKIILAGVGNITENDVLLASASHGVVIGFNVSSQGGAAAAARREGVEIRLYDVIYELLDDVRRALTGMLEPETRENVLGRAEVRQIFTVGRRTRVAGCVVLSGRIRRGARTRVLRGEEVIYQGSLASLKRFQNDAAEVREGQECGIRLDNFGDFQPGDVIECYEIEKITAEL